MKKYAVISGTLSYIEPITDDGLDLLNIIVVIWK
jgi:hypothetical protein